MDNLILNRVEKSGLLSINLEDLFDDREKAIFDMQDHLFQGLVLREKDFREFLKSHDWSIYTDKNVAIDCSTEAIIPTWAYMLVTTKLEPYAHAVVAGNEAALDSYLFQEALNAMDVEKFRDCKVVIKGCSDKPVPVSAYAEISRKLKPIVSSMMFGEPCSTVPVYKRPKHSQ